MNGPGMHSSGPRPKSHAGSLVTMSSPTLTGEAQLKCAVPAVELPDGRQCTPSCWAFGFPSGVLPLLNTTSRSPLGSTTGSEPWSRLQSCSPSVGSKRLPKKQRFGFAPLISSGVDHVMPWSVDIDPKIELSHCVGTSGVPPAHFGSNRKTVQVTYTLSRFGLAGKASAAMKFLSWTISGLLS